MSLLGKRKVEFTNYNRMPKLLVRLAVLIIKIDFHHRFQKLGFTRKMEEEQV
ncbi:unnamed protein product [Arabidopsis halleri]